MTLHSKQHVAEEVEAFGQIPTLVEHYTFRPLPHRRIGRFSSRGPAVF